MRKILSIPMLFLSVIIASCQSSKPQTISEFEHVITDTNYFRYPVLIHSINNRLKDPINTGTGFIYRQSDRYFLVTNYHVLSGRMPSNNDIIFSDSSTHIKFFSLGYDGYLTAVEMPLYDEKTNEKLFSTCYYKGKRMDIAIMFIAQGKLPFIENPYVVDSADIYPYDFGIPKGVDATMIGYPNGLQDTNRMPRIIKTKTIASVTDSQVWNNYLFLTDSATSGMSGSPVFLKFEGDNKIVVAGLYSFNMKKVIFPGGLCGAIYSKYLIDMVNNLNRNGRGNADLYYQ